MAGPSVCGCTRTALVRTPLPVPTTGVSTIPTVLPAAFGAVAEAVCNSVPLASLTTIPPAPFLAVFGPDLAVGGSWLLLHLVLG